MIAVRGCETRKWAKEEVEPSPYTVKLAGEWIKRYAVVANPPFLPDSAPWSGYKCSPGHPDAMIGVAQVNLWTVQVFWTVAC